MKDEGVHFCLSETSANCDAVEGATSPQGSRKGKGRVIGVLKRKDASAAIWHEQRDFSLGNKRCRFLPACKLAAVLHRVHLRCIGAL